MRHRAYEPWLYLAPMLVALLFVFGYPVVRLIMMSFQRTSKGQEVFVGLTNYITLFQDEVFIRAVQNNLTLVLNVPVMVAVALLLAIFLFERIRGWKVYQTTLFLPYLLPIVVVGLIFSYIFQLSGVLN
ncbi:MAG: carbohydrate ABC transporter permease, partial [Anaerolineae bacterium]